jgi:hypothetical protein
MNRKQQRRGKGMVIYTQIVTSATTGDLYWFECPEKFSLEKDGLPPGAALHGPFKTQAEVKASPHLILLANAQGRNHQASHRPRLSASGRAIRVPELSRD